MDSGKSSGQGSSLDSLRTVEFRQTLRGYHIDDVDEYLERVAVDAEALQVQMRQAGERLNQAAERIAQLESKLHEAQQRPAAAPSGEGVSDDTLQRTLLLAQRFVDQTQAEAETQARVVVAEAEERARKLVGEAEARAKSVTEDTERHLREEIARLEATRAQLAGDVEAIGRHMENERNRLRNALSDMLSWVDEHVQPAGSLLAQRAASRPGNRMDESGHGGPDRGGSSAGEPGTLSLEGGGGRPSVSVQPNAATGGAHPVDPGAEPTTDDSRAAIPMEGHPQAIAPR